MGHELVIRGGTVIDGSGGPRLVADVGIDGGRRHHRRAYYRTGDREIDAVGLFVAPGFIDGHAHFDAQIFWDALGNSSSLHGVTTTIMGNCGFTLAPTPADRKDLAIRSIERAEDIARDDMLVGVPWTWRTYPEYLDAVDGLAKGINFGGYVGHSALRCFVMGERAYTDQASPEEIEAMRAEVEAALRAGALGFSTSRISQHRTLDDGPVASYVASWDEVAALAGVLGDLGTGVFQLAGDIGDTLLQEQLAKVAQHTGAPGPSGLRGTGRAAAGLAQRLGFSRRRRGRRGARGRPGPCARAAERHRVSDRPPLRPPARMAGPAGPAPVGPAGRPA